jgi:hypothetical protein
MKRIELRAAAIVLALLVGLTVRGGDPQSVPVDKPSLENATADSACNLTMIDRRIVSCLQVDAQAEYDLAAIGVARAKDQRVKQLAKRLGEDYKAFRQRMVGDRTGQDKDTLDAKGAAGQAAGEEADDGITAPGQVFARLSPRAMLTERGLLRVKTEVVQEWLAALQSEWESASPAEFDRSFLEAEKIRQLQMLGTIKVFQKHASPGFAAVLTDESTRIRLTINQLRGVANDLAEGPVVDTPSTTALTGAN